MSGLSATGAEKKSRVKEGAQLIPKTSFKPIAAPDKLWGTKAKNADELMVNGRVSRRVYEDILRIFIASKIPITLWGPMGSGKTRGVEAIANESDEDGTPYNVITVQPSTEDPTVIHGMMTIIEDPRKDEGENMIMVRSIPEMAEKVWKYFNDRDGLTIMFLDEMTTCIPAQQNAMLGLLTHGKYGTQDISRYVTFVMAANPPGTVQTVLPLSEAVINRGAHIPWYSEKDNWLRKWRVGFGDPKKIPDQRTIDFIEGIIDADPEIAFRDDPEHHESEDEGWSIDDLCPYDQMHFSERAATETAKVYKIISDVFEDAPYEVRNLYIKEAVTAMVGPRWGKHASVVDEKIESKVGIKPSLNAMRKQGFSSASTNEEVLDRIGDKLHYNRGNRLLSEEEMELAKEFERSIFNEDVFSLRNYHAFWLWASTFSEDMESNLDVVIPVIYRVFVRVSKEQSENYPKRDLMPVYVPRKVKEKIAQLNRDKKEGRI